MQEFPKLTKPQSALLRDLPARVSRNYAPAQKLVGSGLAEWHESRFGSASLEPTALGRLWLTSEAHKREDEMAVAEAAGIKVVRG